MSPHRRFRMTWDLSVLALSFLHFLYLSFYLGFGLPVSDPLPSSLPLTHSGQTIHNFKNS